ncbi:hypothetical protein OPV22_034869 [Ensete ventricosum]|uniref:ARC6 IMS domain-containing protein n=1 Tax=Ensete ventricosum TaxID=4639 RepID=A0AAV8PTZ7_ENSVE|nr:hypothetical protein OPV22_034869 [Ensete ventricosum]
MPTFTAIALDRLLEPGSGMPMSPKPPLVPIKVVKPAQEATTRRSNSRPHIRPALYATPETTPIPDSPSWFPPHSPYLINHKRRGPRLVKSVLQSQVCSTGPKPPDEEHKIEVVNGNRHDEEVLKAGHAQGSRGGSVVDESGGGELQDEHLGKGVVATEELAKPQSEDPQRDNTEDFFDPQDSLSTASNSEADDTCGRWKPITPLGEYYDAFDDILSDGSARSSYVNVEDDLHEMRLNVLMEIEKRTQAEEALVNLQNQWQRLRHQLSLVGLKLPTPPTVPEAVDVPANLDPAEELYQQVVVARFVADAVGRGCARAEVQREMETQIASKNFEIARLSDRLQYYEAANKEMSQRNQEAVEMARRQRNRRKRRQRWFWGSIGLAITLGGAAIAWSYHPTPSVVDDTTSSHENRWQ